MDNERLAKLEAKMEIIFELLQEIRDDIKNNPSKAEYDELKRNQEELRKDVNALQKAHWKQTGSLAILGVIFMSAMSYIMRLIIK